ncbi:MAG: non-hydrolyzing UDP-N-acetylglucosamine 2-epimerase [Candidatus Muiribacteriaceae bacterium]
MRILTVIGARPQFIKAAAFSKAVRERFSDNIKEVIIHTGQHYDSNMSEIFFNQMNIPRPDYNLDSGSDTHARQTADMMVKIEDICIKESPDYLLVYGDTNSTLAGALAAGKLNIPVLHIEAGLRSRNMNMPEEKNRILTDHISSILFCPTEEAEKNLHNENVWGRIIRTGDIMYDSFRFFSDYRTLPDNIPDDFILCTVHRAENTDSPERLEKILSIFRRLEKKIILPLHPRTKKHFNSMNLPENVIIIPPVGYPDMLGLLHECEFVMTDSGGLQKEAAFAGRFCVTLRDETEWTETVQMGWNLVSSLKIDIICDFLKKNDHHQIKRSEIEKIFGNGNSAEFICKTIIHYFSD